MDEALGRVEGEARLVRKGEFMFHYVDVMV